MSIHSLPALLMAAVTFYVGGFHLLICRRRVQRRHHFLFALTCFMVGCYDVLCAMLYAARCPAEGAVWQRAQIGVLGLVGVTFLWFVHNYTGHASRRGFRALSLCFIASALVAALAPPDWVVDAARPMVKDVRLPWGWTMAYQEAAPGPVAAVQTVIGLAGFVYVFRIVLRAFAREGGQRMGPLLLSLFIFFLGVLNDSAVSAGLYRFVYLIEYAYMGIVLLMAVTLTSEVSDIIATKEHLHAMEERFGAVFKNTAVGIALADSRAKIIAANSAMCGMLGQAEEALRGTDVFAHILEADAAQLRHSIRAILRGELGSLREERRYVQPDGSAFWGDMSFALVRQAARGTQALLWINVGITERRRAVDALQALNEALEQKVAERTTELEKANRKLSRSLSLLREDEEAGRMIQFNLLPAATLDAGPFRFSRHLVPSLYLSGDFVDYFEVDADHTAFYIADVAGHGVSSAFVTVLLHSLVSNCRDLFESGDRTVLDPARLLTRLNAEFARQEAGKHVTILYGVLRASDRTLTYANAGQFPLPVLCTPGAVETLPGKGVPVGLFEFATYTNCVRTLPPAFVLGIFSDGVLEAIPGPDGAAKEARLARVLAETPGDAADLGERLGLRHTGSLPDDVTILLLRGKPGDGDR